MLRAIGLAIAAEHVRHFEPSPGHRGAGSEMLTRGGRRSGRRRARQQLQGAFRGADLARGDPQILGCGRQAAVAKQELDGANVGPGLEQMDREGSRRLCGVTGLDNPERRCAVWQASPTACLVIGSPGRSPGKSQSLGRTVRQ